MTKLEKDGGNAMIHYHKRGGLHFLRIGRLRVQWSWRIKYPKHWKYKPLPKVNLADFYDGRLVPEDVRQLLSRPDESPSYRNAMIDSGRGRLLR